MKMICKVRFVLLFTRLEPNLINLAFIIQSKSVLLNTRFDDHIRFVS